MTFEFLPYYDLYFSSTSVSSPGETMPRSDSADSQSQAIQEEPLPSTSNEEDDPLAGWCFILDWWWIYRAIPKLCITCFFLSLPCRHQSARRCGPVFLGSAAMKTSVGRYCRTSWESDRLLGLLSPPRWQHQLALCWEEGQGLLRSAQNS